MIKLNIIKHVEMVLGHYEDINGLGCMILPETGFRVIFRQENSDLYYCVVLSQSFQNTNFARVKPQKPLWIASVLCCCCCMLLLLCKCQFGSLLNPSPPSHITHTNTLWSAPHPQVCIHTWGIGVVS